MPMRTRRLSGITGRCSAELGCAAIRRSGMEKKNHLFDGSIEEKIERQRGRQNEEADTSSLNWKAILMGGITVLFAVSVLLRIFM